MDDPGPTGSPLAVLLVFALVSLGGAAVGSVDATAGGVDASTPANASVDGPEYDLTTAGSLDTPDRTVSVEGRSFAVTGVTPVDPGGTVTAVVTAPDAAYRVFLYNVDREVVLARRGSGDGRIPSRSPASTPAPTPSCSTRTAGSGPSTRCSSVGTGSTSTIPRGSPPAGD